MMLMMIELFAKIKESIKKERENILHSDRTYCI